jgi:hypothetical protein
MYGAMPLKAREAFGDLYGGNTKPPKGRFAQVPLTKSLLKE